MRAEVGEDLTEVGAGCGTIQCGAEHMDSGSDYPHPNLGLDPHFSVIWGKNLSFW